MGGLGTFGPCEPYSVHFKNNCQSCSGRGYHLTQAVSPYSGGAPGSGMMYPVMPPGGMMPQNGMGMMPQSGMGMPQNGMGMMPQNGMGMPQNGMGMMPQNGMMPQSGMGMMPPGGIMPPSGIMPPGYPNYTLVPCKISPNFPQNVVLGTQNDSGGVHACAIAHTKFGDVPGKAKNGTCWYPYADKEHSTTNFSWVVVNSGSKLVVSSIPPVNAIPAGRQHDSGIYYVAIAQTDKGTIPGKSLGGTCWYGYGGREHTTNKFMWVCSN